MPWIEAQPVIDPGVRNLCTRKYPGRPRGCPNYGKRVTCPPQAPMIPELMTPPYYLVWNAFDIAGHMSRLQGKHPDWSEKQLACCRYWQPTARKALRAEVEKFMEEHGRRWTVIACPEACGLNVHASMEFNAKIRLDWPPRKIAYQVALVGRPTMIV
jgi:predicted metal-binding protein